MKAFDNLTRNVPPGGIVIVKAIALGMSESGFNRFANEIQDDDGIDDFDFVKLHRLGDSGWQHLSEGDHTIAAERPVDAITLRRRKN